MSRIYMQSPLNKREPRYSDFSVDFDLNPITGNISRLTDEKAINQSLKAILLSNRGEKPYNKYFGSTINSSLFDIMDPMTIEDLRNSIIEAINNNEPRVTIQNIDITEGYNDLSVNILYSIINIPEVYQTTVNIKRVR